jgi:hypothetical protein
MGLTTDFHKISRSNNLKYIFMLKRGLRKIEAGRARERATICDIVSTSSDQKKAAWF